MCNPGRGACAIKGKRPKLGFSGEHHQLRPRRVCDEGQGVDGEAAFKAVLLLELVNFDKGDLLFGCGVKDSKPDKRGARLLSKTARSCC